MSANAASTTESSERILIIDHDQAFRTYISLFLKEEGYEPIEAADGPSGINLFHEDQPQAVLLDLHIPGMNGLGVLASIVNKAPYVPVVLLAGEGEYEEAMEALRLGAWDYAPKSPQATDTLAQVLDEALSESYTLQDRDLFQEAMDEEVEQSRKKLVAFRERLQQEQERARQAEEKLEQEREQVQEMTITLKHVVQIFEQDKKAYARDLARRVSEDVIPEIQRMAREQDPVVRDLHKEVIEDQLSSIVSSDDTRTQDADMIKLTPTEVGVCDYIRSGRNTSEIADLMHLSLDTIQTHRKNIRKKLGLVGRKVSLYSYLRSRTGV